MTIRREATRIEDMSQRGRLRLLQQPDGDIIIAVQSQGWNGLIQPGDAVEFCTTGGGGGRSPRTFAALLALMDAIDKDNAARPIGEPIAAPAAPAAPLKRCAAARDGDCTHAQCPQLRDNEPRATGRHCPLDVQHDED